MFGDIGKMMMKAQALQSKMAEMQEELQTTTATGVSGGGLVEITLSGKGDLRAVRIDPQLVSGGEAEIIEDLIAAAHADARQKVEAIVAEKMAALTGGLPLPPGFKLPF